MFWFPSIKQDPWLYDSWIYYYLCNQCLSPLMLWVRISIRARCTTLSDKVCQWLVTGRWFSPGPPVSSTNKTDRHEITEILLKMALNTINQTNKQSNQDRWYHRTVRYRWQVFLPNKFGSHGNSCNIAEIDDKYPSPEPRNKHLLKSSARVNQQRNKEWTIQRHWQHWTQNQK